jgi:hypothetical protein
MRLVGTLSVLTEPLMAIAMEYQMEEGGGDDDDIANRRPRGRPGYGEDDGGSMVSDMQKVTAMTIEQLLHLTPTKQERPEKPQSPHPRY